VNTRVETAEFRNWNSLNSINLGLLWHLGSFLLAVKWRLGIVLLICNVSSRVFVRETCIDMLWCY